MSWSGSTPVCTELLSRAFQTKLSSWLLHQEGIPVCFGYCVLLQVILYPLDSSQETTGRPCAFLETRDSYHGDLYYFVIAQLTATFGLLDQFLLATLHTEMSMFCCLAFLRRAVYSVLEEPLFTAVGSPAAAPTAPAFGKARCQFGARPHPSERCDSCLKRLTSIPSHAVGSCHSPSSYMSMFSPFITGGFVCTTTWVLACSSQVQITVCSQPQLPPNIQSGVCR